MLGELPHSDASLLLQTCSSRPATVFLVLGAAKTLPWRSAASVLQGTVEGYAAAGIDMQAQIVSGRKLMQAASGEKALGDGEC